MREKREIRSSSRVTPYYSDSSGLRPDFISKTYRLLNLAKKIGFMKTRNPKDKKPWFQQSKI